MVSSDDSIIVSFKNSIVTKINTLIGNHNRSNTAHSDIRSSIPTTTSRLTNDSGFITSNDVKNNLTSIDTNKPLSANQGRLLRLMDGEPMVLKVTGKSIEEINSPTALQGDNIVVDYGDGTIEPLGVKLIHNYTDGKSNHTIKIYNVTSFGVACFANCSYLTSVSIPNSVTSLGEGCFANCSYLTSVSIPNSVTSLGRECLGQCIGLTSIVIPSSVTSINDSFTDCSTLNDYYLNWINPPITWNNDMMPNNTNTIFHIPYGTTANYVAKGFPSNKLQEEVYVKTSEQTTDSITDNDLRPVTSNAVNDAISGKLNTSDLVNELNNVVLDLIEEGEN